MRKFLQKILASLAKSVIKKYQPKIVAITGSVGKTSAREAVHNVLSAGYPGQVGAARENYNNELGVPLAILGAAAPGKSAIGWLQVFCKACGLILKKKKNYPRILILEMAADRPGDIDYLVKIAPPDVAVITAVGPSHLEFFSSLSAIAEEKEKLAKAAPEAGLIALNRDDPVVSQMTGRAPILRYGFLQDGEKINPDQILASEIRLSFSDNVPGIIFKLNYRGASVPVRLPKIIARHQIYAALAASAAGLYLKLHLIKIADGLKNFEAPPGRMRLLFGIKRSLIIDDTYNAAPASTIAALRVLGEGELGQGRRKVAILGDMLELGTETESGHREVGKVAAGIADLLITVGDRANFASDEARKNGLSEEKIIEYNYNEEAMNDLENILRPSDLILVKGSQGMRMEKIVKDIMFEPLRAEELLVRQGGWGRK
ncbi:MAG: UDP-N-acetylmuramoyl-tripeptide--D-alanyl-D-alanine ligase [bacterium]|nr:UDP-N-acetylmuramoyl-tripeptide--D-alanyl-D-alanine ligase [bacterium]